MTATFSISISRKAGCPPSVHVGYPSQALHASGLAGAAVTGEAAGADHPGPTLSAVTCLASTTGQVAL